MAIKKYTDKAAYDADTKSTTESTVSLIIEGNGVKIDGVNVLTRDPRVADAVLIDADKNVVFISGDTVNNDLISEDWTLVGFVYKVEGNNIYIEDKDVFSERLLNASLYRLTGFVLDGESHEASISLHLRPDFAAVTVIPITYSGSSLEEVVPQITAALEAKCTEVGETDAAWARLAEDGNGVIVQLDDFPDYRRYQCAASGLTISFVSWSLYGDYYAISSCGEMLCGKYGNTVVSDARAVIYYGASGSTPTANVPVGAGQTLVNRTAFEESEYCADLRAYYGTYEAFMASFRARNPQHFGIFGTPDRYWSDTFGNVQVPTKDGGTKYLYGFAANGAQLSYDAEGLGKGSWYSNGPRALVELGDEEVRTAINETRAKFGLSAIGNNVPRWCCVRSSVSFGWCQGGAYGAFTYGGTAGSRYSGFRVSLYKKDSN